ncbi:HNH endonuclease [Flavobacterium sp. JP2137]|uniref:HNH endonuclease n=1 Tax=Flavobacterium sp. JP2137 TaxID=3414510 RepID=UPI003D30125B
MVNLNLNDVAANNHFKALKDCLQNRIKKILKNGVVKSKTKYLPNNDLKIYLNYLLIDDNLKQLIIARPESITEIISFTKNRYGSFLTKNHPSNIILNNLFVKSCYDDTKVFSKHDFIKTIDIDTCPYCNRSYIYYLSKNKEIKPEIDHFFPKSKYPFLAMSFYNLIPSCQTCNGFGGKEEKDPLKEDLINPYLLKSSDFSFTFEPISSRIISTLLDKNSIKVKIIKNIPGHLDVFKLKELYELHSDHVVELIFKSKIKYSDTYRAYLEKYKDKGLEFSDNEIDRMILGNYATEEEIHKRPLTKLYQDIGKELGLIK